MDNKCSHREYYAQFVTATTKLFVLRRIGEKALNNSTDEHLNDIPLSTWDGIGQLIKSTPSDLKIKMDEAGEGCSPATLVCIAKEAARQIIDNN